MAAFYQIGDRVIATLISNNGNETIFTDYEGIVIDITPAGFIKVDASTNSKKLIALYDPLTNFARGWKQRLGITHKLTTIKI